MELKSEQKQHFHVLAVDDSVIDRKLLQKLLTLSSYQVTCVESVDKALEYLGLLDSQNDSTTFSSQEVQGSKINLIMTDYSMPGMNGYDLLKRVKGSSWKDVPVVIMSSENVPSRITMCLEGGAEEFLLKPVKLSDLRKLQSQLLNSLIRSCKNINNNFVENNKNINTHNNDDDEKNDSIINNANKRKGISPEPSERRPKMKELVSL